MWRSQQPELITTSTFNGSSSYLMPRTAAQGGNLITCLSKSQFKPPRGLAFCLDKPPEHACLLQGCSWQFNTREYLIKKASGRKALLAGSTRQNNKSPRNGICSFILTRPWTSGKSLKLSWVGTEESYANCLRAEHYVLRHLPSLWTGMWQWTRPLTLMFSSARTDSNQEQSGKE